MLANHPKTLPEPLLIPMYAKEANRAQKMIETKGRPLLEVVVKILGAFPTMARPSGCGEYTVSIKKVGN